MFKWIRNLFTYKYKINLGKAHSLPSGAAILATDSENTSPAAKLHMITNLLGGQDVCPTCGHITETAPLITKEEALKLLGISEQGDED